MHKTTSPKNKSNRVQYIVWTYIVLYQAKGNDTAVVHRDACTCFWISVKKIIEKCKKYSIGNNIEKKTKNEYTWSYQLMKNRTHKALVIYWPAFRLLSAAGTIISIQWLSNVSQNISITVVIYHMDTYALVIRVSKKIR